MHKKRIAPSDFWFQRAFVLALILRQPTHPANSRHNALGIDSRHHKISKYEITAKFYLAPSRLLT